MCGMSAWCNDLLRDYLSAAYDRNLQITWRVSCNLGITQLRYFAFQSRILACGSMLLANPSVCGFPRCARKTAHDKKVTYRSAEGSARQLRKS